MKLFIKGGLAALALAAVFTNSGCQQKSNTSASATDSTNRDSMISKLLPDSNNFKKTIDGKQVKLYELKGKNGMVAAITNYGGRLVSLLVPDKNHKLVDVVDGFDSPKGYQDAANDYYGALIGRYGNRIAKGQFKLDGKTYNLFKNNGPNSLHGGKQGFDSKVWDAKQLNDHELELTYTSKDMEEGYPGTLKVKVTYTVTKYNSLQIMYEATTDKPTVVNLTNHAYWNLNGAANGDILKHVLQIDADNYTPVDSTLIPTGKIEPVHGTPFDFKAPLEIGARIKDNNEQLKNGKGYDHNYVLNKHTINTPVVTVIGDKTGLVMKVFTTEPGIQFYSGNFMSGKFTMKHGLKNEYRTGFCLETQHYPDSPNQPQFPSTELLPGKTYKSMTLYQFEKK
jgi:aldose 1-epimerase